MHTLRANGNTLPIIGRNIGITEKMLRKHFKREFQDGRYARKTPRIIRLSDINI